MSTLSEKEKNERIKTLELLCADLLLIAEYYTITYPLSKYYEDTTSYNKRLINLFNYAHEILGNDITTMLKNIYEDNPIPPEVISFVNENWRKEY